MEYYLDRLNEYTDFNYPNEFKPNIDILELLNEINNKIKLPGQINKDNVFKIAGRVLLKRKYGKLYFYSIKIEETKFQILCNMREYTNDNFKEINNKIQIGDIIGATGYISASNNKEPSLVPINLEILSPCYHLIPKTFECENEDNKNNGKIVDVELKYGKRYLDLMINDEPIKILKKRSNIIKFIRNYLDNLNYVEVDTPILHKSYGGANAKPFVTFHHDLKQNMYLRIAPELNLKQLAIGGFNKIFEIGKNFRNEKNDTTHLTEFLSLELYQNYANYNDMLDLTEKLLSDLVKNVNGSYNLEYNNKIIDFTPPFNKIDIIEKLKEFDIDMDLLFNMSNDEISMILEKKCADNNIICFPKTIPKMLDKVIGHYLEPLCQNPTFLINHPAIMSPLARRSDKNKNIADRFELFIHGVEYANAYSELNNPKIQEKNFEDQFKDKNNGDDEAQIPDKDFVTALEYGLPPCAGLGIGLERLIMLLNKSLTIKETTTFPPIK